MLRLRKKILFLVFLGIINPLIAQDSLKIMSYNLGGMKPGTDPQTRIFYAIQYLKKINPDIIGLQEINESLNMGGVDNQAKMIADSLSAHFKIPYYTYLGFTHLSWDNTFNEYVGIISKYSVQETGFFSLTKGVFPRKILWNQINTPLGKINFFNTHLDHLSADIRVQQVQETITYIAQTDIGYPATASILTGDFNDVSSTPTITVLTNRAQNVSFIDTYREANPNVQGNTIPANAPSSRIDYIFSRRVGKLTINSSAVVMNQPYSGNNYCSDHLGVMTIFSKTIAGINNEGNLNAPENFELYQNYPNPFNPTTKIEYRVGTSDKTFQNIGNAFSFVPTFVTLKVYDVLGREISSLVSEEKGAGNYQVSFDASRLASGMYFYKINAGNYIETMRMMFVK